MHTDLDAAEMGTCAHTDACTKVPALLLRRWICLMRSSRSFCAFSTCSGIQSRCGFEGRRGLSPDACPASTWGMACQTRRSLSQGSKHEDSHACAQRGRRETVTDGNI